MRSSTSSPAANVPPTRRSTLARFLPPVAAVGLALFLGLGPTSPSAGQDKKPKMTDQELAKHLGLTVDQVEKLCKTRGVTREMLCDCSGNHISSLQRKLANNDVQRKRAEFCSLALKDEKGEIKEGSRMKAIEQVHDMCKKVKKGTVAGVPVGPLQPQNLVPNVAGIGKDHHGWEALGPSNVGGRTRALVVHPTNPNIMYAGAAAGGIWKTTNGGQSWYPLDDYLANLAVCAIAMDPTNPDVLYVGTGEGYNNVDFVRGGGIFKTADGGATWKQLQVPLAQKPSFYFVDRLVMSPDGKTLLASVGQGDINKQNIAADAGLYVSTDANHSQWQQIFNGYIGSVSYHPTDKNKLIASSMEYSPRQGDAYWSADSGRTWQLASPSQNWLGRVEVTYARANPNVVYASVAQPNTGGEIWRSTDGGHNYVKMNGKTAAGETVSFLGAQGWYGNVIWAGDPASADFILVGGINLWKSSDGGNTVSAISNWLNTPASPHADHHVIVAHCEFGKSNKTVFFGCDGGIYRADDVTTCGTDNRQANGWKAINDGYMSTQFFGIAVDMKNYAIYGGTQDNGTWKLLFKDGRPQIWNPVYGGDGGLTAVDQADPTYAFGEYVRLAIFRIGKNGQAEDFISGFAYDSSRNQYVRRPAPYNIPEATNPFNPADPPVGKANFIAPFALDPNNGNRLLAGGASLWVTNDARTPGTLTTGPSWASLKAPLQDGSLISAIAVAKGNSDVIWVGYNNSQIYVTRNGTNANPTWTRVDEVLPNRMVTRLMIDPANPNHVFALFGGYSEANLWETTDSGKNWRNASAGLPLAPFRAVAIHPRHPNYMYLATEVGLFTSDNGGKSWEATNEGACSCRVDDLAWMGDYLIAATHGRGVFRIDLSKV
jgi:photosystem II stability/assembly factor-like uncharacterized protein